MINKKETKKLIAQVNDFIQETKWIFAKTYKDFAPHEYVVVKGGTDILAIITDLIKNFGVDEYFKIHGERRRYRYWHNENYKYWVMPTKDQNINIINRVPIDEGI